jgi:hypothetical protein
MHAKHIANLFTANIILSRYLAIVGRGGIMLAASVADCPIIPRWI